MAIDFANEHVLRLCEAAKLLPRHTGRNVHASTLWRWARIGCKSRSGRRVYLDHTRMGGVLLTSAEALERFGRELAQADCERWQESDDTPPTPKRRTESQREKDIAAAEEELDRLGV